MHRQHSGRRVHASSQSQSQSQYLSTIAFANYVGAIRAFMSTYVAQYCNICRAQLQLHSSPNTLRLVELLKSGSMGEWGEVCCREGIIATMRDIDIHMRRGDIRSECDNLTHREYPDTSHVG